MKSQASLTRAATNVRGDWGVRLAMACSLASLGIACSDPGLTASDSSGGAAAGGGPGTGGTASGTGGAGASTGGASASTGGAPAGGGSSSTGGTGGSESCTDEYPFDDGYTCAEQAGFGKCQEDWLIDYCNLSCGRCGDLPGAECGITGTPPDLLAEAGVAPPTDCTSAPADECPFGGLVHACKDRFALGINYAWRDFGADFGGMQAWELGGITANVATYNQDLSNMRANGVSVIRWWMFPDLRGDAIERDETGTPTGLSATAVADIQLALELAQRNDVYLVLTLFSFDAFRPTRVEDDGTEIPGISALVESDVGRMALVQNVVTPVAQAVAASPYASRLLGWDVINEPEWAIEATGSAPEGNDFDPNPELDAVPLADMKAFLSASLAALGTETPNALRSVGWAAAKWAWAFADVTDVEFNQPHIYKWVNDYWPYTTPPADLGYPDRPVVMGEFYLLDGPFEAATPSFATVMSSWYDAGYAGAWPWQYFDGCVALPGTEGLDLTMIADFASAKGCSVSY
jgi:hypothetical protein